MKDREVENRILLAALLHDIGKFYQRADDKLFEGGQKNPGNEIGEISFNLAQQMCPPTEQGRFGYHHVVWTSQFFENPRIFNKLKSVPGLTESVLLGKDQDDSVVNLACQHHLPESLLQALIQQADWWSAGIDRNNEKTFEKDEKPEAIDWGKDFHKKKPLASVFDFILTPDYKEPKMQYGHAFPLVPLNISENIFPQPVESANQGLGQEKYRRHWNAFVQEFELLPAGSFESFFESLLHLMRKYTWCIPSNTNDMAHVSLYDHLRLTAAFAHCFYAHYKDHPESWKFHESNIRRLSPAEGVFPVLLVGGDITGIQDFIYNIASSKAAQSLKGRSFYLQLFIETLVLKIIQHPEIRASQANVVYASGGKFYMVLPNTARVKNALREIHREAERELWDKHHGRVGVLLEWEAFAYVFGRNEKGEGNILTESEPGQMLTLAQLWHSLSEKLQQAKPRLFLSVIAERPESLFDENHEDLQYDPQVADGKVCAVTGVLLKRGKTRKLNKEGDDEFELMVEDQVGFQIDLGKSLKDADFILTFMGKGKGSSYLESKQTNRIEILGIIHYLIDKDDLRHVSDEGSISSADHCLVTSINDTNFLQTIQGQDVRYGFRFYGGNEQACMRDKDGQVIYHAGGKSKWAKTVNELTCYSQFDDKTESYVGVLRMDVDGLGDVFVNRIHDAQRTFSFYATLSSMLDLFFSGYLNTLRNSDGYRDYVNILYSGGDDLFIIGRWDKAIEIARDIRRKFALFVRRDDLSISGGLVVVHNKFPIRKAADLADEAEKKAKAFDGGAKNALAVFNETFGWQDEFNYVEAWKNEFTRVLSLPGSPKNLVHRVMYYYSRKKRAAETPFRPRFEGEKPDFSYKWQAAYSMRRLELKYDNNQALKQLLQQLKKELFASRSRNYDLLGVSARWAELELRFTNPKN